MSWRFKASKYKNASPWVPKADMCLRDLVVGSYQTFSNNIAASGAFVAFNWEHVGSSVAVVRIDDHGRKSKTMPVLQAHNDTVTFLDFSPFHDGLLATGSQDCSVKLWHIPEKGLERTISKAECTFETKLRKVETVGFHPTADFLLSGTAVGNVYLWDLTCEKEAYSNSEHPDVIQSLSWKTNGQFFATTCKDKMVRVVDPRLPQSIVLAAPSHQSVIDSRVVWLGDQHCILTTGFDASRQRQVILRDVRRLSEPKKVQEFDCSTGVHIPLFDPDTNMLFLAGKGDVSISYHEVTDKEPFLMEGIRHTGDLQTRGVCLAPKRILRVMEGEVNRVLQLTANSMVPISYQVPRKSYREFHSDLFPDTIGCKSFLRSSQWLKGANMAVPLISLDPSKREKGEAPIVIHRGPLKEEVAELTNPAIQTRVPEESWTRVAFRLDMYDNDNGNENGSENRSDNGSDNGNDNGPMNQPEPVEKPSLDETILPKPMPRTVKFAEPSAAGTGNEDDSEKVHSSIPPSKNRIARVETPHPAPRTQAARQKQPTPRLGPKPFTQFNAGKSLQTVFSVPIAPGSQPNKKIRKEAQGNGNGATAEQADKEEEAIGGNGQEEQEESPSAEEDEEQEEQEDEEEEEEEEDEAFADEVAVPAPENGAIIPEAAAPAPETPQSVGQAKANEEQGAGAKKGQRRPIGCDDFSSDAEESHKPPSTRAKANCGVPDHQEEQVKRWVSSDSIDQLDSDDSDPKFQRSGSVGGASLAEKRRIFESRSQSVRDEYYCQRQPRRRQETPQSEIQKASDDSVLMGPTRQPLLRNRSDLSKENNPPAMAGTAHSKTAAGDSSTAAPASAKRISTVFGRVSKFRHLKGTPGPKQTHIENVRNVSREVPGECDGFQANEVRVALPITATGGKIAVFELRDAGRLKDGVIPSLITAAKPMDFQWDPFQSSQLAAAYDDGTVRLWAIPADGLREPLTEPTALLQAHEDKVLIVRFHPLAPNVLLTVGCDMQMKVWDLTTLTERYCMPIAGEQILAFAWSPDGRFGATVAKDGRISVYEPRRSEKPVREGTGTIGTRGARIVWALQGEYLVITGFDKASERQIHLYKLTDLNAPVATVGLDTSPAILVTHYDEDSSILFAAGKGESTIYCFEITDEAPYICPLSHHRCATSTQGISFLGKEQCNVAAVEFAKAYRLTKTTIEPLSFTVPRIRTELFQDDLFPDTKVLWEPTLTTDEWFSGKNKLPARVNLQPSGMEKASSVTAVAAKKKDPAATTAPAVPTKPRPKDPNQMQLQIKTAIGARMVMNTKLEQDEMEGVDEKEWTD